MSKGWEFHGETIRNLKHRNTHSAHYERPQIKLNRRLSQVSPEEAIQMEHYQEELKLYGIIVLIVTWLVFIVGMGSIFNLWNWCFNFELLGSSQNPFTKCIGKVSIALNSQNDTVGNYYVYCFFLSFAILWIWCVISWISMKLFRHSKGIGR